jgi:CheY-like chemotaxis protein
MELENVPFDLRDVVSRCQSVMLPAAAEKGLVLKVAAQTAALENKRLLGDPVRLYQALLNLLSNAIKFTPQGEIELSVLAKALPDNKIGADFAIRDTGIGMTPEQASRIYEPFVQADSSTTRNYGGSGLGLTITKNIVELMGGKLTLESTYGIGSTFTANIVFDAIDISDSGDDAGFTKPAVPVKPFFDARILVVDDNSMNQQVIAEHLSSVGIKTVVAGNGKEGIDKVKERIFKGEAPFDLIFMDIYMPIMDGIEASQEIAALGIGTPVIAVTANVMSSDLEKYRRYGMPDCLGKPFTSQELWSLLLKYLTPVAKVADEGGDYSPVHQEKMHQKMRYHFIRNNENIFENICAAIETQDVKATHRMLHTLKSNAGLIGEARLQKIAQEMESMFTNGMIANGIMPVFGDYLGLLRAESKRVISDLRPLLELSLSGARLKSDEPLSIEQIKELVDKLEPLLKKRNTECLNLLDDIRNVPEMEELANQMERYDFRLALGTLGQLKIDWGFGDGQSPEV